MILFVTFGRNLDTHRNLRYRVLATDAVDAQRKAAAHYAAKGYRYITDGAAPVETN